MPLRSALFSIGLLVCLAPIAWAAPSELSLISLDPEQPHKPPKRTHYNGVGAVLGLGLGGPTGALLGGGKDALLGYGGGMLAGSLLMAAVRPYSLPVEEGLILGTIFPGVLIALPAAFFYGDFSPGGFFGGGLGALAGGWLGYKIGEAIDLSNEQEAIQLSLAPAPQGRGLAIGVNF